MFRSLLLVLITCVPCFAFQAGEGFPSPEEMQSKLEKAQSDAVRPGDEKLDCNALQEELVTSMSKPEVQAYFQKAGTWAKKEQEEMKAAKGRVAVQTAVSMFSSLAPGGDWAAIMAAKAQAPMQQAQTMERLQKRIEMMNEMMPILPHFMRGQRVVELAQGRRCEWVKDVNTDTTPSAPEANSE